MKSIFVYYLTSILMLKIYCAALLIFMALTGFSQEQINTSFEIKASLNSYLSSGNDLPFWMTANQNGIFSTPNSSYQLMQFGIEKSLAKDSAKLLDFFYGTNLVYSYSNKSEFQMNQYWAGGRYKKLIMKIGAQSDPILYNSLSSTNGNMDWSNNARPLPGVSLSTDGFIPFFFYKKWFSFKAFYSENLLLDNRYTENAHLHHKNLTGRASFTNLKISLGLDHWVYWGGNSLDFGPLPGFENYFHYIIGLKGGSNSPENERNNVSGNSLGIYLLTVEKNYRNFNLTFYYNHPFEDRSGLEMDNIPDGLWGLHYQLKNRKALLSNILYEFQNTANQSGTYNMIPVGTHFTGRGNDNYFNNYIYKSGHVHYNKMMGSPFFVPVIDGSGKSIGFDNTRIWVHHTGAGGWLGNNVKWKSLLSWSRGFGTYDPEGMFAEPVDQFSFLTEGIYFCKSIPLQINMGIAGDYGQRFQQRIGGYVGISWIWK